MLTCCHFLMSTLGNAMPYYYPDFQYDDGTQCQVIEKTLRMFAMSIFLIGFHGVSCPFFSCKHVISFFFFNLRAITL